MALADRLGREHEVRLGVNEAGDLGHCVYGCVFVWGSHVRV